MAMYTKEINERSPLRVFERSIHGGLGKGNIGVVMSRAGVGKTACLIGIALDDLMRGRRVLHISFGDSVEHVREFYEEIFEDLRRTMHMADAQDTHLTVERSRMIHTYRGIEFSSGKLERDTQFYKDHLHFQPEVVVIDGFNFAAASEPDLTELKEYAKRHNVELWLSAITRREDTSTSAQGIPNPVGRFEAWISVMVQLEPRSSGVLLRLLKDHENPDVENLRLRLDPRTLLLASD
jgi:KaiC/GvpD/RAD55 family RecA-like ATPase